MTDQDMPATTITPILIEAVSGYDRAFADGFGPETPAITCVLEPRGPSGRPEPAAPILVRTDSGSAIHHSALTPAMGCAAYLLAGGGATFARRVGDMVDTALLRGVCLAGDAIDRRDATVRVAFTRTAYAPILDAAALPLLDLLALRPPTWIDRVRGFDERVAMLRNDTERFEKARVLGVLVPPQRIETAHERIAYAKALRADLEILARIHVGAAQSTRATWLPALSASPHLEQA